MGNQEGGGSWEGEYLQRRSMTRRPSDKRPVDLWKKERPLGGLMGKPSPEASPPVSELESPNTNRIPLPGLSHPPTLVVLTATAIEEEEDNIHRNSINSSEDATLGDSPPQPIVLILNDTSVCVCVVGWWELRLANKTIIYLPFVVVLVQSTSLHHHLLVLLPFILYAYRMFRSVIFILN